MSTYTAIPEEGIEVTSHMEGVDDQFYDSIFSLLDQISQINADTDPGYREVRFVVANYIYLIYERLKRNMVRELDYEQVKSWANKNRKLATYLLSKQKEFPMEAFEKWISPVIDLTTCAMYERSNRFTKNIPH